MNRSLVLIFSFLGLMNSALAVRLQDYIPFDYDVRFTNPQCATYNYETPLVSKSGQSLVQKPQNVYCKTTDAALNINRAGSPSEKLLEWINQEKTTEIFMTYLSFSNSEISGALCNAMKSRGVRVRLVQDGGQDHARLDELEVCGGDLFDGYLRGHVPGIDFAHNKVFIVNPGAPQEEIQISFGSGNLTSGIVLHHENWHFITTNRQSYFAQSHLCLMTAEIDHAETGKAFSSYMNECLAKILTAREDDIRAYFVPGQGGEAWETAEKAILESTSLRVAAHRFSFNKLIGALTSKLQSFAGFNLQLLVDDDVYWVHQPNTGNEKKHVMVLESRGAKPRYLETNHGAHLLHHNKFIIFDTPAGKSVFVGAGNFTGTAFTSNWENFYFVTIPSVVQKMEEQYDHLYNDLATAPGNMPTTDVTP